jgi:hypothetical protein
MISDFRLPGGTTSSNIEEMKAQKRAGLSTGLLQLPGSAGRNGSRLNRKIKAMLGGRAIRLLQPGTQASCRTLVIRHPRVMQRRTRPIPRIKAQSVHIIINQTPHQDYGGTGRVVYNINLCNRRAKAYFGKSPTWHPIGPLVRDTLKQKHRAALRSIKLSPSDWVNIINVAEWRRKRRPVKKQTIRIGRHSRDAYVKWPSGKGDLLRIYPDHERYEIHVLGGAATPERILGKLPSNWKVLPFGSRSPKSFLAGLDVFVYYTHPDCVEAFGRVIFEAMAVGVPVILPYSYKPLFGAAALYAEPADVRAEIDRLMADDARYEKQVARARRYVEAAFGYSKHLARLKI